MLEIVFNNTISERKYQKEFFEKIAKAALAAFGLSEKGIGLSINLVGTNRMRLLNQKHRRKNKPTDVLSFPLHKKADLEKQFRAKTSVKKPRTVIIELGDIFICLPVIRQQAEKENNLESLLCLLTVHSILHLLGFDHEQSASAELEMQKWQDKILNKL
ncbi:MAG: rRNA maturation RNase YbeY [bacterium]|nr:rRNA maturation RNase YbeY [bacterium]